MRDIGVTHAGLVPWSSKQAPTDLATQLDAVRRFSEEVIAHMD
jgi:hypothetical protein